MPTDQVVQDVPNSLIKVDKLFVIYSKRDDGWPFFKVGKAVSLLLPKDSLQIKWYSLRQEAANW